MALMRQRLIRCDLAFPAPANPLDFGICPVCRVLVPREKLNTRDHKRKDAEFQSWLDDLGEFMTRVDEFMAEACKRLGMAEEAIEIPARWDAEQVSNYFDKEGAEPVPFYPDSDEEGEAE